MVMKGCSNGTSFTVGEISATAGLEPGITRSVGNCVLSYPDSYKLKRTHIKCTNPNNGYNKRSEKRNI